MKIVFATCEEIPNGTADDEIFKKELTALGHNVQTKIWTDPTVRWENFEACLLRSTWDYHKRRDPFLNWAQKISAHLRLMNPLEVLRWNSSKEYLLELQDKGASIVPTQILSSFEESLRQAKSLLGRYPQIILKPVISATSDLTYFLSDEKNLPEAITAILQRGKIILQPFIPSVLKDGELSLIYFRIGKELSYSHSVQKKPKAGDFRVQSEFGGSSEPIEPSALAKSAAEQILPHLPKDLFYARLDFLDWKSNPQIGEIELVEPELFFRHIKNSRHSFRNLSLWFDEN